MKRTKTTIKPAQVVTDLELADVSTRRLEVQSLRRKLRDEEAKLAQAEAVVVAKLQAGATCEARLLTATLEERLGACRPPWKDVYLQHMATHGVAPELAEQAARDAHPPKTDIILAIGPAPGAP